MCRKAQVTLIELSRVTTEIRARQPNTTQPKKAKTEPKNKHQPKTKNTQTEGTGLVSHHGGCKSRSDCLDSEVKRGH